MTASWAGAFLRLATLLSVASQMPLDDVLGACRMFADEAGTSSAPVSRNSDRRRARDRRSLRNELGDVIWALIAAVALAILQRLGRS